MSTNHEHKPFTIAAEWLFFALFSSTNLNSKYPLHAAAAVAGDVGDDDDCTVAADADTVAAVAVASSSSVVAASSEFAVAYSSHIAVAVPSQRLPQSLASSQHSSSPSKVVSKNQSVERIVG